MDEGHIKIMIIINEKLYQDKIIDFKTFKKMEAILMTM